MPEYKDSDLASFVMTTVGTLISQKDGSKFRLRYIAGKVDQKDYINAYLNGGDVQHLKCNDTDKCLSPSLTSPTIPYEYSMKAKVLQRLQRIKKHNIKNEN